MPGYIHVYTGDGKGKTSAAMGLALRAAGNGMRVVLLQFLKGSPSGEIALLQSIPGITVLRNSKDYGFFGLASESNRAAMIKEHTKHFMKALSCVHAGACDMLILDEAAAAYTLGAMEASLLDDLIENKPAELELVLTGRDMPSHILMAASYVSNIQKVKHPFDQGISARPGIEF